MISKERAVQLVEELLSKEQQESPWIPEAAVHHVKEHAFGWLLVCQSVEYVRSGDPAHLLVGSGPYLVDGQDGSIHHIPVTTYHRKDWEKLYLQQIKGVRPPDPLLAAVRTLLHHDGTVAALRHLRRHAPRLTLWQAKAYVVALRSGAEPPEELVHLTQKEELCPPLPIETLTGPAR
ncbi:YrhB domain-containing protein [Streptomyces nodosus]|uniref:YrhB domain-containing protein n=1 Tax=Streptomyces nodosus TaxID=40318 RepID=UPI00345230ED